MVSWHCLLPRPHSTLHWHEGPCPAPALPGLWDPPGAAHLPSVAPLVGPGSSHSSQNVSTNTQHSRRLGTQMSAALSSCRPPPSNPDNLLCFAQGLPPHVDMGNLGCCPGFLITLCGPHCSVLGNEEASSLDLPCLQIHYHWPRHVLALHPLGCGHREAPPPPPGVCLTLDCRKQDCLEVPSGFWVFHISH